MEFEKVGPYTRSFKDLMSHEEEIKNDTKMSKEIPVFIMGLKLFIGEENLPPYNEIVDIFGKMVVNSYCIYSGDLQEIGTGLYLGASFFDHSCEPNAAVTFNGPTLYVRTLQDMDELDYKRIFISYIDQMATTKERQRSLKEQYFFVCQCYRCNDPKLVKNIKDILMTKTMKCATEEDVTKVTEESKRTVELLAKKKKENDAPSTILEICKHCLSQQEGVLDSSNVLCVKILDQAFDASISLGKWEEAIDFSLATLEPYRLYYGNYHPNLGIQLFRIGKIELFMERLNAAKKILLQAEKVIAVTHGTKHPIYQDLLKLIDQCQEELNIRKLKNISV
ncbi:histone-lysine N-methyltransferase SMYD3-like [Tachypleus tridentatus]|uniref:histone-lysine N-methyltransferase SMYD3-like n=1 Tax=Tachypleus tridentatus TaxID=6853 RepID=UPI003FD56E24